MFTKHEQNEKRGKQNGKYGKQNGKILILKRYLNSIANFYYIEIRSQRK